jgi:hypothetical protein
MSHWGKPQKVPGGLVAPLPRRCVRVVRRGRGGPNSVDSAGQAGQNDNVDGSRHVGSWAGACFLAALDVLLLVPAAWYVIGDMSDTSDGQANHAHHVAAAHGAAITVGSVAGGVVVGLLLRRLSAEPATAAGRALAATSGALLGILLLDVIGFFWMAHDGSLFSNLTG